MSYRKAPSCPPEGDQPLLHPEIMVTEVAGATPGLQSISISASSLDPTQSTWGVTPHFLVEAVDLLKDVASM